MGRMPWGVYCWPGLPLIWRYGSWVGLAIAVGFAALVNLALASSLLWSELFTSGLRNVVWVVVAVIWAASALLAYRRSPHHVSPERSPPAGDSFALAMDHYLKGNWFEAEFLLSGLLARNPRDVDAGLLLATLLRHTGRTDESIRQLDRLDRLDEARKWELEIRRERELIDEARAQRVDPSPESAVPDSAETPEGVRDAA